MNKVVKKPFFEHLEELRLRKIKSILSVIIFSILGYIFSDKIIELLSYIIITGCNSQFIT